MLKYYSFLISLIVVSCYYGTDLKQTDSIKGPGIITRHGMVVSASEEASGIGVYILEKGGNAIDAAVATGLALAVCYPEAGNLGGGGFMVIRTSDGAINTLDFREKAPIAATSDMYLDSKGNVIEGLSTDTRLASGVPGSAAGLLAAHKKYGRLSFRDVIRPAIEIADKGFPVTKSLASSLNKNRQTFIERNTRSIAFVKDSLWKEGDILKQPDLARTLRSIRDKGDDGFYKGTVAKYIIDEMKGSDGLITEENLENYQPVWRKPLTGTYRDYKIISVPLPSSGGLVLMQILTMMERFDIREMGFHSLQTVHLIIEAERRAFADRAEFMGDPDFIDTPVNQLISRKYLEDRMSSFDPAKASTSSEIGHGTPGGYESSETTHYSIVDNMGNAVATTTTLNNSYGNSIVVQGAGFLLNNEMDDFSVKPGYPNIYGLVGGTANAVESGKRMLSSMTPTIIEKDGKLFMVAGSPGGSTIPTSVLQVVVNCIDYGMNIQDAVNSGRFHHQWVPDTVMYENNALDSATISHLEQMGHQLKKRLTLGQVNAIMQLPDGTFQAGADSRGDNVAAGY
jgi:gamma-glutamyltranspeptidase/glutathione hydrolase